MEEQTDRGTTDRWIDGWLAEHRDGQEEQVIITVWENDKTTEGTRERERERERVRERDRGGKGAQEEWRKRVPSWRWPVLSAMTSEELCLLSRN